MDNDDLIYRIAAQNQQQKEALLYVMRATVLAADDAPDSAIGKLYKAANDAYELPDLASPILNKVKAEALNNAADWFNLNYHDDTAALRLRELADAIEKGGKL